MPASSKQQQKFFGIVRAIQKGDVPASKFSKDAQQAAKRISKSDVKKYAKTKHKGLPRKVKQEILKKLKEEYAFYHTGVQSKKRDHDDDNNLGRKKKHSGQPDLNEIGIFKVSAFTKDIIPGSMKNTVNRNNKEKYDAVIGDLVRTLNSFWKKHNIPYRVRK